MTAWIDEHAEAAVFRRLMVMAPLAEGQYRRPRSVDITYCEVEMEPLRVAAAGPSGCDPVLDALEGKARAAIFSNDTPPPAG